MIYEIYNILISNRGTYWKLAQDRIIAYYNTLRRVLGDDVVKSESLIGHDVLKTLRRYAFRSNYNHIHLDINDIVDIGTTVFEF